jgi:hypothetical protein
LFLGGGEGLEVLGEGEVVGLEELEGLGDAGHGAGGRFDDVFELLEGGEFALDEAFDVSVNLLLQLPILNALGYRRITRSYSCFGSFFFSFLGASVDI